MHALTPDFLTAFGMTALAAWTVSWVMWILGRQYWRQGMSQAVLSTVLLGFAYIFFALQSKLGMIELQVTSKTLITAATAAFTIALQRFRQSTDWKRDSITIIAPLLASSILAIISLSADTGMFNRTQTVVTVLQTAYALSVLFRMRANTPGLGWVLVTVATCVQIVSLVPLVFSSHRPSPSFGNDAPIGALLAMWGVSLMLFLNLVVTFIGFLIMLRDRQTALERHKALLDPLTQLPNRAALVRDMTKALDAAARSERPLSVMIMDIDHFKRFNDKFGHLAGDQVIQLVARILQQQSRERDVVSRYGGEEFVLVLPNTDPHEAQNMAIRLCNAIRNTPLKLASGKELHITVSVGVHAGVPPQGVGWEPLIEAADAAMYHAKRKGRDRVEISVTP
ncbi:GGDEF domain-containing protein [Diaphorobacter sp. HDW4A]|uniref:GGDEF domain-containing protein n=1 Tax=Diaphorobacter sp. HDW4A TaxID=2714924 RepID=UPI0014090CED|nr:GGDEF domain-containing protein [Diaphorobacter sp. HDW4A]QIL83224.1 GGDEF domain-containing protein [Diaphorobacter sp. HDW4A]